MEKSSGATRTLRALDPWEYHVDHLRRKEHSDGRPLTEYRPSSMQVGVLSTAHGSAMTKLGNTTIMVSVKGELAKPAPDHPDRGFLVIHVDGTVGNLSEGLHARLQEHQNILNGMEVVPLESLCVRSGKLAWVLYCDVLCMDVDGSVFDAALAALVAALHNTTLPSVTVPGSPEDGEGAGESGKALNPLIDASKRIPLTIPAFPVVSTFSCLAEGGGAGVSLVADPAGGELEWVLPGTMSLGVLGPESGDPLCGVWVNVKTAESDFSEKPPFASLMLSDSLFNEALLIARRRHAQVVALIKEASNLVPE